MIHHWKALDLLEITDFEYHDDQTYIGEIIPSQTPIDLVYFSLRFYVVRPLSSVAKKFKWNILIIDFFVNFLLFFLCTALT